MEMSVENTKIETAGSILACVAACALGSLATLHFLAMPAPAAATPKLAQLAVTSQVSCQSGIPTIAVQARMVAPGAGPAQIAMVDAAGRHLPLITVTPQEPQASGGGTVVPGSVTIVLLDGDAPAATNLAPIAPSCSR